MQFFVDSYSGLVCFFTMCSKFSGQWTGADTFVRAATLWASSASTSGRVSALRMVCCSFCSASSSFSWSCRFLSSVCNKQTNPRQIVISKHVEDSYALHPGLRVCFQFHKVKRGATEREREERKRQSETREWGWVRPGWAGSEEESIHNDTKTYKTHEKREERHLHLSEYI